MKRAALKHEHRITAEKCSEKSETFGASRKSLKLRDFKKLLEVSGDCCCYGRMEDGFSIASLRFEVPSKGRICEKFLKW